MVPQCRVAVDRHRRATGAARAGPAARTFRGAGVAFARAMDLARRPRRRILSRLLFLTSFPGRIVSAMTLRSSALRFTLVLSLLPSTAFAGAWLLPPGDWSSEIRGTFLNADTYRNGDGDRMPFPDGGVLEQRTLSAWNEFGWKKRLGVFVSIPFVNTSRRFGDDTRLPAQTVFGDLQLGARYALMNGPTAMTLNAIWKAPMGYNREIQPAPGTGQQDVGGTLAFGAPIGGSGFVEVEAGYLYRFEAPADQIIASAGAGWWFGPLLIGGRYMGAAAAGDGDTPANKLTEHLVGPVVLYRIDDHLDLSAGSLHTAAAENAIHADRVYVALTVKQSGLHRLQGFLGNAQKP